MIIWRGHGILIPVFAIFGALVTGMAFAAGYAATHWEWVLPLVKPANVWGMALGIWLYGRTIGKTVIKTYLDPATHQEVVLKKSHTLFFIGPMPWAVLTGLMACFATVKSFQTPRDELLSELKPKVSTPASRAFEAANDLIDMDKGKTAYGNTPDAEKIAEVFSQMMMVGREIGVQKARKKPRISLSHGKFLSYCRINPDSCAFMVHVPELRKFSEDAKRYMVGMAWTAASLHAAELNPRPKRVAVGVRGAFLYDEVVEGPLPDDKIMAANDEDDGWEAGIEQRFSGSDATKHLETYFEPHPPGAVLPTLGDGSEITGKPAKEDNDAAAMAQAREEFDRLITQFENMQPGQAEGNVPAAKELAAAYAKTVWDGFPFPAATRDQMPQFSAHVHLGKDTAAFMLGLPGEGEMPPGGFMRTQPVAWKIAAMVAEQMIPKPKRLGLILFMDGQRIASLIGARESQSSSAPPEAWKIGVMIEGSADPEELLPFFSASSDEMIAVKTPVRLSATGEHTAGASPEKQTQPPAQSPAATAEATAPGGTPAKPAPSPLPTVVRDWKDATGRVMQASLESFTTPAKDVGRFKRADGQTFEVPFARLSAEDQQFIQSLATP
ncbi:MAG: hypothetical protein J0L73_12470 [Verrucomicrobia bacterium]|nr:hypothetical protein [Verrucomicrobiota bacterium]